GDLPVRPCLLRQVVENDQRVLAAVAEIFAHRCARVRGNVLHRGGFGCRGGDDDGVLHRAFLLQPAHDTRDGRCFLAYGDVDALDAGATAVADRVDRDGSLAGLAVADDEFALAATDRHHRIDGLEAGLYRLVHGFSRNDAGRYLLDGRRLGGFYRALAGDGLPERINDAPEQRLADRNFEDAARRLDGGAFRNVLVVAEHHRADGILLQVQRKAERVLRKLEHFSVAGIR